jgi:reactive intermediate/imine deaminase
MKKRIIRTTAAPTAIGTYSQAVAIGETVYLSGQIGLDPKTMKLVDGIDAQIEQVFRNLEAVASAAGGSVDDVVRMVVYLTDMHHFAKLNVVMAHHFHEPYPARAAIQVAALPRGALVEVDAIMVVGSGKE